MSNYPKNDSHREVNPREMEIIHSLLSSLEDVKKEISELSSLQRKTVGPTTAEGTCLEGGSWAKGTYPLVNIIAVDAVNSVKGLPWKEAKALLSRLGIDLEDSDSF